MILKLHKKDKNRMHKGVHLIILTILANYFYTIKGMCCSKSSIQVVEHNSPQSSASPTVQNPEPFDLPTRTKKVSFSPIITVHKQEYETPEESQVEAKRVADEEGDCIKTDTVAFACDARTFNDIYRLHKKPQEKRINSNLAFRLFLETFDLKIKDQCSNKKYRNRPRTLACYSIVNRLRLFDDFFFQQQTLLTQKIIILTALTAIDCYLTKSRTPSQDIEDINMLENIMIQYKFSPQGQFYTFEPE